MISILEDTDFQWKWWRGQGPNYPNTGPATASGGYLLMDSHAAVVSCSPDSSYKKTRASL